MKKIIYITATALLLCCKAQADTIMIVDDNNVVKQQIYTSPTVQQPVYVTGQPLPPQQVIVTQSQAPAPFVVVRETPAPRNYYYNPIASSLIAGFGGALLGNALFNHHYHHPRPRFHHRRHHR